MNKDIIHEEIFSHGRNQMHLYIISNECYQSKEGLQSLIEDKHIQTLFHLTNVGKNLSFEQITKSLVDKSREERCNILYNEIYSTKKNIGLILTETNNECLIFFSTFMILKEVKNEQWLNEQNFYQTLLKTEQEQLKSLIKNTPTNFNDIFLHTNQIQHGKEDASSEILFAVKPQPYVEPSDLNPPFIPSSSYINPVFPPLGVNPVFPQIGANPEFPLMGVDSKIFNQESSQDNKSIIINTQIIDDSNPLSPDQKVDIKPDLEQEKTIPELAPPIKFQSFYQKYTIKCFK